MFIKRNPLDIPSHHKEFISKADAGKVFASIAIKLLLIGFVSGVLLVLLVLWFVAPDQFSAIVSIVGIVICAFLIISYLIVYLISKKHKRYLAKYGIKG